MWNDIENGSYTEKELIDIVTKDPMALTAIPRKSRSRKVCMAAVSQDGFLLEECLEAQKTQAMILAALEASDGEAIQFVSKDKRSREVCLKSVTLHGTNLQYLEEEKCTEEICLAAFEESWQAFAFFPKALKDAYLETALEKDGRVLQFIDKEAISERLCDQAVTTTAEALGAVPFTMRSRERCLMALRKGPGAFPFVPDSVRTRDFYLQAVTLWPEIIKNVPLCYRDPVMLRRAVRETGLALKYVKEEDQNADIVRDAVSKNGWSLFYAAPEFRTDELTILALYTECLRGQDIHLIYTYLDNAKKTKAVQEAFEQLLQYADVLQKSGDTLESWVNGYQDKSLQLNTSLVFDDTDRLLKIAAPPFRTHFHVLDTYKKPNPPMTKGKYLQLMLPGLFELSGFEIRRKIHAELFSLFGKMLHPRRRAQPVFS